MIHEGINPLPQTVERNLVVKIMDLEEDSADAKSFKINCSDCCPLKAFNVNLQDIDIHMLTLLHECTQRFCWIARATNINPAACQRTRQSLQREMVLRERFGSWIEHVNLALRYVLEDSLLKLVVFVATERVYDTWLRG